jgi:hypothetical protein
MSDETRRVLDLLEQNKITAAAAHELLRALAALPKHQDRATSESMFTESARKAAATRTSTSGSPWPLCAVGSGSAH